MDRAAGERPRFGIHTLLQNTSIADLIALWARIEELGFDWISVGDHFYSFYDDDLTPKGCHEALTVHAALACSTSRVRCGSLVYSAMHRQHAVFAKAIATIDHLSNGRAEVGIGAGWAVDEFETLGMRFPPAAERLDVLEETVQCVARFLRDDPADFGGAHCQLVGARCQPMPIQARLPIWVGGGGEKRTLRIVAEHADGWSVPFASPEEFARKKSVLAEHCDAVGRDPRDIRCAPSVGFAMREETARAQFGSPDQAFLVSGSAARMLDRVAPYIEAGADQVNFTMRAPWDLESLERLAGVVDAVERR